MSFPRFRQYAASLRHPFSLIRLFLVSLLALSAPAGAVDLLISKFTDSPDPAVRGGTIAYTASITNNAVDTATNARLHIALDPQTVFVSVSDAVRCSYVLAQHRVECAYPTVRGELSGAPADVFSATVNVTSKAGAGSTVSATATVSGDDPDTNGANNTLSQISTIDKGADLALALSASPNPVLAGGVLTYTAVANNLGPNAADTTTVSLTLSPNLTHKSSSGTGWNCSNAGQVVTCTRTSADVGIQEAIKVEATVSGALSGTLTTSASVSISGTAIDYQPSNNTTTADVTVNPGADLTVGKSADFTKPQYGGDVTFKLAPANKGPFQATNVVVEDTVPAGFSIVSAGGTGWTCSVTGQAVRCTRPTYAAGAVSEIQVKTAAPAIAGEYTNTVTIASDTPDADPNNNSGSVKVNVMPPGADLSITKTKTPTTVSQGGAMVSTIRVTNAGPKAARSGEVSVIETLAAGETYVSSTGSGNRWSCATQPDATVKCTYANALGVGETAQNLVINTTATSAGTLVNTACAVYKDSQGSDVDPVSGNNCASGTASATAAANAIDLAVTQTVDLNPLAWDADTLTYTITVTNLASTPAIGGPNGVLVSDLIPGRITSGAVHTPVTFEKTGGTATTSWTCFTGQNPVRCRLDENKVIAQNETVVFKVTVKRPMLDSGTGVFTNTASVSSGAQGDSNPVNNESKVTVKVEPVTDLKVTTTAEPTRTEAGTEVAYVLTVDNLGPSSAAGITLSHKLGITGGNLTYLRYSSQDGTCTWDDGLDTLNCSLKNLISGGTATVTVTVRPDHMSGPPPGRTLTGTATVATTSNEGVKSNNTSSATVEVIEAALDLLVNTVEQTSDPLGFAPVGGGWSFPNNVATFRNTITNRGPSVASNVVLTYTMTPPAGKEITFLGGKESASGQVYSSYCNNVNVKASSSAPLTITCSFPANMILEKNADKIHYLDFRVETTPSPLGDTFRSDISVSSSEPDLVAANNVLSENTSVKMRADLQLAKSARAFDGSADVAAAAVQLRQPFYWVLTLTNTGPGDSQLTSITDTLPAGLSLYTPPSDAPAPYSAAPYNSGVRWSTDNATPTSGSCSGTTTLSCDIGVLEGGKVAVVRVPVIATTTGAKTNCASASTASVDPNLSNNKDICANVDVQASSLAGAVYADQNANGSRGAAEPGIAGVALLLEGKDAYGNAVARNATSAADGSFSIGELSPGTYKLTETHPTAWIDGVDVAGTAGGTPGAVGTDAIEAIALPGNTAATGYLFGEVTKTSLSGYVFVDNNGNARRDAGETTGIAGVTMTLTGTDDAGAVNKTVQTGASGLYTFADLRPGTYQVEQAVIAGVTHTGMTVGSKGGNDGATVVAANTAVLGAAKRSIGSIVLAGGDLATDYNFGESGQGLSGFVYVDRNGNGSKDADEPGIPGVAMTLSGNTAGGVDVCAAISPNPCTVTTGANGAYGFSGVPASDATGYRITEQSQATAPLSNYADGQERAGSLGGSTATNDVISGIVVRLGEFGANYDFGERGGAIAGRVYLDSNDNGALDGSETGIAGVTLTLSGRTVSGADVCTILASCTLTSGADGTFAFSGLPSPDGDGYLLTETQPVDYAEGSNTVGTGGGTAAINGANSTISAIRFNPGVAVDGYLFGEKPGVLSGHAYVDANNNGMRDAGETGIAGVTFTLSGTTASGVDVCTRAACTATSGADGAYRFAGLPNAGAGGYTITQQAQNVAPLASYLDGKVAPGTNCGACSVGAGVPNTIGAVPVGAAAAFTGYDFGELRPASLAGSVYLDSNLNGAQDGGEALAGVTLTLSGNDDLGAPVNRTATSGADGTYRFEVLRPSGAAGYTLTETQPAVYGDFPGATGTKAGSAAGTAGANTVTGVVLANGVDATGYEFRETSASIAGRVYMDRNDNGVPDAGEGPLAGVTLTLAGQDVLGATVSRVVQTAADGSYRFVGLPAGVYAITETHPAGVLDGRERAGSSGGAVDNGSFDNTPARNAITAIALPAGAEATGYDFGEREVPAVDASLSGRVYQDLNGNGKPDVDEPGIPGVTLHLSGNNRFGAPIERQTVTGADGRYSFSGLPASDAAGYRLDEIQPTGYSDGQNSIGVGLPGSAVSAKPVASGAPDRIEGIVVNDGMLLPGYDFGERQAVASVAGKVYLDRDDDGVQDAGEPGIAGVALVLSGVDKTGATVRRTTTSGADGGFRFTDLPESGPAGYQLLETQPSGYRDGKTTIAAGQPGAVGAKPVAQGASDTVGGIVLAAGRELDGYRFGEVPLLGSLGGVVWLDRNNDGAQDAGETGIPGVALVLSGNDKDGNAVRKETTSGADGSFRFVDLPASGPAGYQLAETQPAAYADGKTMLAAGLPGTLGAKPVGPEGRDTVSGIVLAAGDNLNGYRFGELAPTGSLGGVVYLDRNDDGVQGAGETGIAGVAMVLSGLDKDGKAVRRDATSGADGNFRFTDLPPSSPAGYLLTQTQPTAYRDGKTTLAAGLPGTPGSKPIGADGRDTIGAIVLAAGDELTGYRFGELPMMGSLGGVVWLDRNNDGVQGAGEAGIAGVVLTLSGNDKDGNAVRRDTTSGADGSFRFADLPESAPAGYLLVETQPAAYLDGKTVLAAGLPGTLGAKPLGPDGRDTVGAIVLAAGQHLNGYRFGELPQADSPASLGGVVYLDRDDDGVQDAGEPGIAGVTLVLSGLDKDGNALRRELVTGADGAFRFADLPPSNPAGYLLAELQPTAYADGKTTLAAGLPGLLGAKPIGADGRDTVGAIVVAAGENLSGYRFGELRLTGSLGGLVWLDRNDDGVQGTGETGIAGVTLVLSGLDEDGIVLRRELVTGADGSFRFNNLPPSGKGGYQLVETQPAGYRDGKTVLAAGLPGTPAAKPIGADGRDTVGAIALAAGQHLDGYRFGELPLNGSLGGVVWLDRNNDGVQDGGETGIAGVALVLSGLDKDGKALRRETITGADGSFRFADLPPSGPAGYQLTETQPKGFDDGKTVLAPGLPGKPGAKPIGADGRDMVDAIVLAAGQQLDGYRFGELGRGRIAGSVYLDRDGNGMRDDGDTGMGGVSILLGGRQLDGTLIERSVTTGADGGFAFEDVPASDAAGYRLTEVQPGGVNDGRTTVAPGLPGSAAGGKPVGVGDHDVINAIRIAPGVVAEGYLFGETAIPSLKPPIVNGYVWLDRGHNRVRPVDGSMQGLGGWTVQLLQNEKLICQVLTNADGFYQFDNLHCPGYEVSGLPTGGGFEIVFSREGSKLPAVAQSGGNRGKAAASGGRISDIQLTLGDQVIEQNLPLDPAGIVYDLRTRKPVPGATVVIAGPAGFVPARHLVGAEAAATQVTGNDGMYQFLLQGDFPTGVYTLTVSSPAGYLPGPSAELKACAGAATVTLVPTPALVQKSDPPPGLSVPLHRPEACAGIVAGGADSTQYYLGFHITNGGSAPILNNHIPLDPVATGGVVLTKTTPRVSVARGELVPYTITASNSSQGALPGVVLRDRMPPGFKYRPGSARIDGVPSEPKVDGRELSWPARTLAPRSQTSITLVLAVGAGVGEGQYVNQADAVNTVGAPVSNIATAAVRIVPDATFDCPDVIGKVFDDANANGYQDEGEAGLPAVRLATPRGLLVTTDAQGRFHVPCAELPNPDRGTNFVMKLDERTLPSGYRVTTSNPGDVRVTRGKVAKLNFGATIHRVVRIELEDAAYGDNGSGDALSAPWKQQIDTMMEQLKKKPSVLRIAYRRGAAGEEAARRRVAALSEAVQARWMEEGDLYPLAIEVEDVR